MLVKRISKQTLSVQEHTIRGMMEILEYISYCLLEPYGYATPWYTCERIDIHYPLHVKALDLSFRRAPRTRNSNSLGGFRV